MLGKFAKYHYYTIYHKTGYLLHFRSSRRQYFLLLKMNQDQNGQTLASVRSIPTPAGNTGHVTVPVTLHVFNFALPAELHVKSLMNFSYNTILSKYGVTETGDAYWAYLENIKQFFIDHRLPPITKLKPRAIVDKD